MPKKAATKKTKSNVPAKVDTETRVCSVCNIEKFLRQFHNHKGAVCNSCYRLSHEEREERRFVSQIQPALTAFETKMREFLAHRRGTDIKVPHLMELYQAACNRIGGAEAWAEMWYTQLHEAIRKAPGSKTVLDNLWKFAQFAEAALAMRDSAPDVSNMSDGELRTAILAELFVEFPEMFDALKATRPKIAVEIIDAGFDPETGKIRQEDTRFDADAPEDEIDDSQFDEDDAEEVEFTKYDPNQPAEVSHASTD